MPAVRGRSPRPHDASGIGIREGCVGPVERQRHSAERIEREVVLMPFEERRCRAEHDGVMKGDSHAVR